MYYVCEAVSVRIHTTNRNGYALRLSFVDSSRARRTLGKFFLESAHVITRVTDGLREKRTLCRPQDLYFCIIITIM